MAADIGKLFNFLKDKEDRPIPLKAQFKFTPENIDWEGLAYDQKELNLIKDTDNLENVVWEKVPQNTENLKWIIRNSPDNVRMSSIDINDSGMISLLGSNEVKVPIEKFKELKIDELKISVFKVDTDKYSPTYIESCIILNVLFYYFFYLWTLYLFKKLF